MTTYIYIDTSYIPLKEALADFLHRGQEAAPDRGQDRTGQNRIGQDMRQDRRQDRDRTRDITGRGHHRKGQGTGLLT